jgi:hypothetical protein
MSLVNRIWQRLKRDYFRSDYQRAARAILTTPPLAQGSEPFTVLSQVHQRDVTSYLVAIKSFAHFLNPRQVVVVCDPSIGAADRAILKQHVPHIVLRDADEFTHPDIPRGGTWERLYAISEYARDSYVVQVDADTLTLQPIPEVRDAVAASTGFVLGEMPDTPMRLLPAVRENALPRVMPGAHIQSLAEAEMVNVGLPTDALYVRGCSGFTGFPPSTTMRAALTDFSKRMTAKLHDDWKRWGTEQVTSNYLVANAAGTKPLPFPKYGTPDCATADTAFSHFIGSMRFVNSKYAKASSRAIELIRGAVR